MCLVHFGLTHEEGAPGFVACDILSGLPHNFGVAAGFSQICVCIDKYIKKTAIARQSDNNK